MLLKQLLNGRFKSDFILIKDNSTVSGLRLLKQFIEFNLNRGNNVHFFMYEYPEYDFNNQFSTYKNYVYYDCFSDPWNWLDVKKTNHFEEVLASLKTSKNETISIIVIDSLIYLLLHSNIHSLCNYFKTIFESYPENTRPRLITVLHTEFWQEENVELNQIDCIAKSVISLKPSYESKLNSVFVEHRKPSGTIMKEEYTCSLDLSGNFTFEIINSKNEDVPKMDSNPSELTTFKLTLEEHEKEIRSRVVLPYIKTEGKQSRIYYVPDANDDWDDEDPDDDLEI